MHSPRLYFRQISPDCPRGRLDELDWVRAVTAASIVLRRFAMSGSSSFGSEHSSVLWAALRQRSHLPVRLAFPVKQMVYKEGFTCDHCHWSPVAAAWRLYASSYTIHADPSNSWLALIIEIMYAIKSGTSAGFEEAKIPT